METHDSGAQSAQKLIERLCIHVTLVDASGTILYSSAAISPMLGYTAESLVGMAFRDLLNPGDVSAMQALLGSLAPDAVSTIVVEGQHRDGHPVNLEITAANKLHDPEVGGIILHSREPGVDARAQRETERSLNAALEHERDYQQALKELHEITLTLHHIDTLDEFYRSVVELGRNRLGFDRLALFLYDAQTGAAIGTYGTDATGSISDERSVNFQPSPNGLMLRAFQREERFGYEEHTPLLTAMKPTGIGWNAAAILWDGNQSQGWLTADNGLHHRPASKAHLEILALYSLSVGTLLARKKADAALRQSEADLRAIMRSTSVGIVLTDPHGTIRLANQLAIEYGALLYGKQFGAEPISLFDLDLNDREGVETLLRRALAGEHTGVELTRQVGAARYVLDLRYDPVVTANGQVTGATVTIIDITERKRAEQALEQYASLVQDLYNSAPCGYHSLDTNGLIVQMNDTELRWLGLSREEVVGKRRFREFMTPESAAVFDGNFSKFKATGSVRDLEFDLLSTDGTILSTLVSASAITDADGHYLMSRSTVFDITERKRAEEALRDSEQRFQSLVEGAPEAIIISNADGAITLINAEAEKIFGYSREELIGQKVEILVPDSLRSTHERDRVDYNLAPRRRGHGVLQDVQAQRKNGECFYADIGLSHIMSRNGLSVMTFVADITARKRAEETIRASEARYRLLADNITDLIARVNVAGNFEYVSPSCRAVLGYEPEELIGMSGLALIHPDDLADVMQSQLAALSPEGALAPTFRYRHKDGHYVWVETSGQLISSEASGEMLGFIVVARDITERYKAQDALKQSEALLRMVLENLPVGVWLVAPDGTITLSNAAGIRMWEGAIRTGDTQALDWRPETGSKVQPGRSAELALRHGDTTLNESVEIETYEGTPRYLLSSAIPIRDNADEIVGAIIVNEDVTVMKLAENALRESFEKEKELGELKSRFVSMASHEFRTPLATILSSSEMMLNYRTRMDDEKINRRLNTIADQVKHLASIVEDVLDLTRMQSGRAEFKPTLIDLDALCREVLDEFRNRPDIQQTISYECEPTPSTVAMDKKLIRQVVINLIANATKYSEPETTVLVSLKYSDKDAVLRVHDEGIGIPEADLRHLFEPFHRAANVGTIPGTGLGLSITRQAVEMHGGAIRAESVVNEGTTFTVTLPLQPKHGNSQP